jgi:tetratricopeptide (TPR) repeat protein
MALSDVSGPEAPAPAPRRPVRRRWPWLVLAAGVLAAGGLLAREGWAIWQERAARQAMAEEQFDEAQRHIDQTLRVRPRSAAANLLAARIARLRGAYSEAEQYLARCTQFNGMSDPLHLEWLLLRCQRGEVDELAPGLLASVDGKHPESAAILEALAAVYMRQTRYQEAIRCLDRWVELAPDSVRALDWRGWVSNQLDHRGQAIGDYEQALEAQPGRSAVRLRLAEILVESSRHEEATPHLERLRQEQPDNSDVPVLLARCFLVQSRTDEARELLDSVSAAHPRHFEALLRRGELEYSDRHYTESERWQRKALEQKPLSPEARYALYLSLQAQGNRQAEAEKELARWQHDRQSRDRLVRLLRTELDLKPNDPELAKEAGELFLQLGEDERGLFWLRRALALKPQHVPSLRALIAYYERTNNPDMAAEYRQKLSAAGPVKESEE